MGGAFTTERVLETRIYSATNPLSRPDGLARVLEAIERYAADLHPDRARVGQKKIQYSREAVLAQAGGATQLDLGFTRSRVSRASFSIMFIVPRSGLGTRIDATVNIDFFEHPSRGKARTREFVDLVAALAEAVDASYGFAHNSLDFFRGHDPHRADSFATSDVYEAYWLNVYGRELVERLGRPLVRTAPAPEIRELSNGGMLLVTDRAPMNFAQPESRAGQARYLAHFGRSFHRDDEPLRGPDEPESIVDEWLPLKDLRAPDVDDPETAVRTYSELYAEQLVALIHGETQQLVNFNARSLSLVDELFWERDYLRHIARGEIDSALIPAVGAYVGEVLVRNLGGRWIPRVALKETQVAIGDRVWLPFVRARNFLQSRDSARTYSLVRFYKAALES